MGKEWMVKAGVHCFKITIEDGHENRIDQAMQAVSRIPFPYAAGLEIVSGDGKNGLALYKDLGGAAGHGGRLYLNVTGLDVGVLLHELGHVIEQEVRFSVEDDLLDRWKREAIDGDKVSVSGYGDLNPWEDMAEFSLVYAICMQGNKLDRLRQRSPNRFRIWNHCVQLVNTSLRKSNCDATSLADGTLRTDQVGMTKRLQEPEEAATPMLTSDFELEQGDLFSTRLTGQVGTNRRQEPEEATNPPQTQYLWIGALVIGVLVVVVWTLALKEKNALERNKEFIDFGTRANHRPVGAHAATA